MLTMVLEYEDPPTFRFTIKAVRRSTVRGAGGALTAVTYIRLPVIATLVKRGNQQLYRALYDLFAIGTCSHEHDCCGCRFGGIQDIQKLSRRDVRVVSSYVRNY